MTNNQQLAAITAEEHAALIADCKAEIASLIDHIARLKRHDAPFDLSKYESQLRRQQIALASLEATAAGYCGEMALKQLAAAQED